LISREKEIYDDALPSGNGVAGVMLTKLGYLTGETAYLDKSEEMYYSFYDDLNGFAFASPFFMQSLLIMENPSKEVVIIGADSDANKSALLGALSEQFLPEVHVLTAEKAEEFQNIAPFAAVYKQIDKQTTVYVCENFACQQPTTDINQAA